MFHHPLVQDNHGNILPAGPSKIKISPLCLFLAAIWRLQGRAVPFLHPSCLTPGADHSLCYRRCLSESLLPASPKVCSGFLFGEKEDDERRSGDTSRTAEFFSLSPPRNEQSAGTHRTIDRQSKSEGEKTRAIKPGNVIHKISFLCGCCFIGYFNPFKIHPRTTQNNKGIRLNFWL